MTVEKNIKLMHKLSKISIKSTHMFRVLLLYMRRWCIPLLIEMQEVRAVSNYHVFKLLQFHTILIKNIKLFFFL